MACYGDSYTVPCGVPRERERKKKSDLISLQIELLRGEGGYTGMHGDLISLTDSWTDTIEYKARKTARWSHKPPFFSIK
jgi:hypothetical protein